MTLSFSRSLGADRIRKFKDPVRFFFFSPGRPAKRSGLVLPLISSALPFFLGLSLLLSPDPSPADSSPVLELSGGEMVFSQQAAFYDAMVGGLFPLEGLRALSSGETPAFLHLFVAGNVITFNQPAVSPDQSVDGLTRQSYIGGVGAVGLRIPASWGFWEGDVGGAYFNVDQTLTPVSTVGGVYLQTELLVDRLGPGSLDLFGSYIGSVNYLLGEGRYLMDAGELFEHLPAHSPSRAVGQEGVKRAVWPCAVFLWFPGFRHNDGRFPESLRPHSRQSRPDARNTVSGRML